MERFAIQYLYMQEKRVKKRRSRKAMLKRESEESAQKGDGEDQRAVISPTQKELDGIEQGNHKSTESVGEMDHNTFNMKRHNSFSKDEGALKLSEKQRYKIDKGVYLAVFASVFAGALSTVISGVTENLINESPFALPEGNGKFNIFRHFSYSSYLLYLTYALPLPYVIETLSERLVTNPGSLFGYAGIFSAVMIFITILGTFVIAVVFSDAAQLHRLSKHFTTHTEQRAWYCLSRIALNLYLYLCCTWAP